MKGLSFTKGVGLLEPEIDRYGIRHTHGSAALFRRLELGEFAHHIHGRFIQHLIDSTGHLHIGDLSVLFYDKADEYPALNAHLAGHFRVVHIFWR